MNYKRLVLILLFLLPIYFLLYKIYIPRVSAFGCFDDCFSYAAGYFLNRDKSLYSEIFYNHQMLPAYISSFIQSQLSPVNIYDLVLKHRQFVMLFGFLFNMLLIFRFGLPALFFFFFFEFTKFYIFGDRFLGEGMVVYPLVYLLFCSWNKLNKFRLDNIDYILSTFFALLIVFLRETFIPIALALYLYLIFPLNKRFKSYLLALFLLIMALPLLFINFKDYYLEIFTVNKVFLNDGLDYLKIIFYPMLIITGNEWNIFRTVLVGIDILFLTPLFYLVVIRKKFKFLLLFIPLMLSNLRVVEPGKIFYEAFHMVPFYGIFIASAFILINETKKYSIKFWSLSALVSVFLLLNYVLSPNVFWKEKVNTHEEFFTNYSKILEVGEVVKKISSPKDTLFVDGYDEVIYWTAQRPSSYKYSMYTSLMPNFSIYSNARIEMFKTLPPDLYYGSCPKEKNLQRLMPVDSRNNYVRLKAFEKPSCVFIRKDKIKDVSQKQWDLAKEVSYELPLDDESKF